MDWKRFYADELASPEGQRTLTDAVERHATGDAAIVRALRSGGVASFPHVSLRDSADPIARVAQSVLESGRRHVVALGVLHGGTMPKADREAWSVFNGGTLEADPLFARFAGAFFESGSIATPFGSIEDAPPPPSALVREDPALLAGEFSLDLFAAGLAAAARQRGVPPPSLTRLFVCAVRSPGGGFDVAGALANEMRAAIGGDTAVVATGDLAHMGHGYFAAGDGPALPADQPAIEALVHTGIVEQYEAALHRHDFAAAWAIGTRWLNDQRHILPVVAALVGPRARFDLLSLELSDYAAINGVPRPCFVAAALGLLLPPDRGMPLRA